MNVPAIATSPPGHSIDEGQPSVLSQILRKRKRIVLVTASVTLLATVAFAMQQTKIYVATSAVVVQSPPTQPASVSPNMATEVQIARSPAVARLVSRRLRGEVSPTRLLDDLSVHVPVDSDVLQFSYPNARPSVAQIRAEAFAREYLALRSNQQQDQVLASASSIDEQIQSLTTRLSSLELRAQRSNSRQAALLRAQGTALSAQIGLLQRKLVALNSAAASVSRGAVLGSAPRPRSPARPRVLLDAIVALFAGLLLGFAVAAAREYADDRLRSATDVQARLGHPVLGVVPQTYTSYRADAPRLVTIEAPRSRAADAFRRLHANFVAEATRVDARSIVVTSIDADDRATDVAANLAVALAAAGKRVVLVSGVLGATDGRGFLDALAGADRIGDPLAASGSGNLRIVGRGSASGDPNGAAGATGNGQSQGAAFSPSQRPERLGVDRAKRVIAELAETADYVLVEAAPLLAVSDAAVLAGACDAVLAVATLPTATRSEVARAREQLERVRATLLGIVVFDLEHSERLPNGVRAALATVAAKGNHRRGGVRSERRREEARQ
jgi:capsular polysaccharide biosynthesis protein